METAACEYASSWSAGGFAPLKIQLLTSDPPSYYYNLWPTLLVTVTVLQSSTILSLLTSVTLNP